MDELFTRVKINGESLPDFDDHGLRARAMADTMEHYDNWDVTETLLTGSFTNAVLLVNDMRASFAGLAALYCENKQKERDAFIADCLLRAEHCRTCDGPWWGEHVDDIEEFYGECGVKLSDGTYWAVTEARGARQLKLKRGQA